MYIFGTHEAYGYLKSHVKVFDFLRTLEDHARTVSEHSYHEIVDEVNEHLTRG